jgi:heme-degrading monooxygenase HmoA
MYAVIFRAEIRALDAEYAAMASRMRDLAINKYGCMQFTACTEGSTEVAISYWESEEHIRRWKQNAEHLVAQEKGQSKWYKSYAVEVVQVVRSYRSGT